MGASRPVLSRRQPSKGSFPRQETGTVDPWASPQSWNPSLGGRLSQSIPVVRFEQDAEARGHRRPLVGDRGCGRRGVASCDRRGPTHLSEQQDRRRCIGHGRASVGLIIDCASPSTAKRQRWPGRCRWRRTRRATMRQDGARGRRRASAAAPRGRGLDRPRPREARRVSVVGQRGDVGASAAEGGGFDVVDTRIRRLQALPCVATSDLGTGPVLHQELAPELLEVVATRQRGSGLREDRGRHATQCRGHRCSDESQGVRHVGRSHRPRFRPPAPGVRGTRPRCCARRDRTPSPRRSLRGTPGTASVRSWPWRHVPRRCRRRHEPPHANSP